MTGFVRFASTVWTVIRSAKKDSAPALDRLLNLYREPVRRYLRQRGFGREQAEDLVQEVFLRIFQKDLLQKVERSKGKFRSFLLGVANNVMREHRAHDHAQKRGGGAIHISIEDAQLDLPAGDEPDFTREWMLHLLRLAMKELMRSASKPVLRDLEIFRAFMKDRPAYPELAERFAVTTTTIKNALYETKQRLGKEVAKLVNTYTYSAKDFQEEMAAFDAQGMGGEEKDRR